MPEKYIPSKKLIDNLKNYDGLHIGWEDDGKGNLTTSWGFKQTPNLKRRFPKGMTEQQADECLTNEAIYERFANTKYSSDNDAPFVNDDLRNEDIDWNETWNTPPKTTKHLKTPLPVCLLV